MKNLKKIAFCTLSIAAFLSPAFSQTTSQNAQTKAKTSANNLFTSEDAVKTNAVGARSSNSGFAEQAFRNGVQSYYRGSFNDSVVQFEKALSYLPSEYSIVEWLGKAYYRSGIEGTALQEWSVASANGQGGLLLKNKIEVIGERRINDNFYDTNIRYTESGSYPGKNGENLIYSQPISVLPNSDGSSWVLAYGSNEMIQIDANGLVTQRSNGPLNGFDRPMDIIRLQNGDLLVSEFAGDRLSRFSKDGFYLATIGSKGVSVGNMVGPQYLAEDENGNIYVSDFGNARIDVFDKDGNPLFYFGGKSGEFDGLAAPTGIAYANGSIYIADAVSGAVYHFDVAGNYLGLLCNEKTFKRPEAMKKWGNYFILCDKNKVYSIDIESGAVTENISTGNAPSRVTCAVPDINGNVLACDFKSNEVYIMSKMSELVGGMLVQIDRVYSDKFPQVTVDVKVENRRRQAVVGLKEMNFLLTENKVPVQNYKFEGSADGNDTADITLIIDRSMNAKGYAEAIETAVKEVAASMGGKGTLRVISAGALPVLEYSGVPDGVSQFTVGALKNPYSNGCQMDMALRLAANGLINASLKRAIVLIGAGQVGAEAFTRYGLSDLAAYLNNNSIALASITVNQENPCEEIQYLCNNTDGDEYYVYRSQGLGSVASDLISIPNGLYRFSFTSSQTTEFGQKYLPVEVEAYLMNRSGRDESGYFAPLE